MLETLIPTPFSVTVNHDRASTRGLELGLSLTDLARHLAISVPAVGYVVHRGEAIARDNHYQLVEADS